MCCLCISCAIWEPPISEKDLSFEVTFNKMPEVDLGNLKDIKISIPEVNITDKDIDLVITNIQKLLN